MFTSLSLSLYIYIYTYHKKCVSPRLASHITVSRLPVDCNVFLTCTSHSLDWTVNYSSPMA